MDRRLFSGDGKLNLLSTLSQSGVDVRATPCCPPVVGSGWPPLAIVTSPEDSARRASLRKDSVRRACLHATVFAWSLLAVNTEQYQVLERARLLRRLAPLERPPIQTMLLPARGGLVS